MYELANNMMGAGEKLIWQPGLLLKYICKLFIAHSICLHNSIVMYNQDSPIITSQ